MLDGRGRYDVRTGIRFLDHMLELVARHGGFDLTITAAGDLDVDPHHTVEDVGIALGEAVSEALGTKRGINRAGYFVMPMDETLAVAAIDLRRPPARGGRPEARVDASAISRPSWCRTSSKASRQGARSNVHLKVLYGRSSSSPDRSGVQGVRRRASRVAHAPQGSAQAGAHACRRPRGCCE